MYKIPIDERILNWTRLKGEAPVNETILHKVTFNLEEVGDIYFNMRKFTKGYLWVNGRNLGRFWEAGPQYHLFCPGVWLKKGENEMYILELYQNEKEKTIKGEQTLGYNE